LYFYLSKILSPLLSPINFLILLIILLYSLNIYYNKKIIKYVINFSITLFLLISLFPIGNEGLKYLEKDFINQKKITEISNIVVLGGAEHITATKNSNKLNFHDGSERLLSSVELAIKNPKSVIYFLGGSGGNLIKGEIDETYIAKLFYKSVDFDLNRVIFVNNSRNTIKNISDYKKISNQDKPSVLITSAFHMKRVLLVANKLSVKFIPYAVDFKSIKDFKFINSYINYSISRNLAFFDLFVRELVGIIAFKLFY
tara:strand:+ start:54 stop:821 length:768 start_codon:yes stop_codon:yes gene_type:complete